MTNECHKAGPLSLDRMFLQLHVRRSPMSAESQSLSSLLQDHAQAQGRTYSHEFVAELPKAHNPPLALISKSPTPSPEDREQFS